VPAGGKRPQPRHGSDPAAGSWTARSSTRLPFGRATFSEGNLPAVGRRPNMWPYGVGHGQESDNTASANRTPPTRRAAWRVFDGAAEILGAGAFAAGKGFVLFPGQTGDGSAWDRLTVGRALENVPQSRGAVLRAGTGGARSRGSGSTAGLPRAASKQDGNGSGGPGTIVYTDGRHRSRFRRLGLQGGGTGGSGAGHDGHDPNRGGHVRTSNKRVEQLAGQTRDRATSLLREASLSIVQERVSTWSWPDVTARTAQAAQVTASRCSLRQQAGYEPGVRSQRVRPGGEKCGRPRQRKPFGLMIYLMIFAETGSD